jgi:hypothetical protein
MSQAHEGHRFSRLSDNNGSHRDANTLRLKSRCVSDMGPYLCQLGAMPRLVPETLKRACARHDPKYRAGSVIEMTRRFNVWSGGIAPNAVSQRESRTDALILAGNSGNQF